MRKKNIIIISLIVLFILTAIFLVLNFWTGFDNYMYTKISKLISPNLTKIMKVITTLGNSIPIVILCLVLLFFKKTRIAYGYPITLTVTVSSVINTILKIIFERTRPNILSLIIETSYSFPSGHAMVNASLYTLIIILIFDHIKDKKRRIIFVSLCILLTFLIGISRIYLGVHYASDILAGFLLGTAIALIIYEFIITKTNFFNTYQKR